MNCARCHGLMLKEHLMDLEASYGEMWALAWRCVNCGHRDDAVMQQHRRAHTRGSVVHLNGAAAREDTVAAWEPDSVEPLAA